MHVLAAVVGAPAEVADGILRRHRGAGRTVAVATTAGGGVSSLLRVGGDTAVVATWESRHGRIAAFGSSVEGLARSQLAREVDRALEGSAVSPPASDLVALCLHPEGAVTAVAGHGAHRLHRRRLAGGGWVVSNHLATVALAGDAAPVDRTREDFFLGFGFFPDGRTPYRGVDVLPPGTVWRTDGDAPTRLALAAPAPEREEHTGSELLDLLLTATGRRAAGRDHHAVLLGGFDSALVCALLRRLGKSVTAFTFDFGDARLNQANVDLVQRSLELEHVWVPVDPERMREALRGLPDRVNGPGAQPHYQLHTVLACEDIAARGFPLVFTGDGCDAAFLGYPTVNRRSHLNRSLRRLPRWSSRALLRLLGLSPVERRLGHVARMGRSALRASLLPWPAGGHLPSQYLDARSLRRLRLDPPPAQEEAVEAVRLRLAAGLDDLHPTRLAFAGNAATGASRVKVDGAVLHTGLAQFTPYGDPVLREAVHRLPVESLRPAKSRFGSIGKEALIEEVLRHDLLPREVVLQPKASPSTSPIDAWYAGPLRPTVYELLDGLPFRYDRRYVEEILAPKAVEDWYRRRVALSPHAFQAIGLLASYAAFTGRST